MVAACISCVYIVCWDISQIKSIDIHWTPTMCKALCLGASQYEFYPKPCQWLAVWFWASPLILVCLISLTCKVGVTIVPAYLPHRGVVRIHVVTYGALNLSEEVWHKHILFFNVLRVCGDWRAKEFHIQATAATVTRPSGANGTHTKAQLRLCHHPLCDLAWIEIFCSKNLGNVSTDHQQLQTVLNSTVHLQRSLSFVAWTHTGTLSFVDSGVLSCLRLVYLGGIKLRNRMDLIVVKGKGFDWFL